jgi:hypothetical protein
VADLLQIHRASGRFFKRCADPVADLLKIHRASGQIFKDSPSQWCFFKNSSRQRPIF